MYRIKAPNEKYERKIGDIRFVQGVAETNDPWLASWLSGRLGFTVEPVPDKEPDQKDEPPAGEEKSAAADPSDAEPDPKPKTRKGRKKDDEGDAAGETGGAAADIATAGD